MLHGKIYGTCISKDESKETTVHTQAAPSRLQLFLCMSYVSVNKEKTASGTWTGSSLACNCVKAAEMLRCIQTVASESTDLQLPAVCQRHHHAAQRTRLPLCSTSEGVKGMDGVAADVCLTDVAQQ